MHHTIKLNLFPLKIYIHNNKKKKTLPTIKMHTKPFKLSFNNHTYHMKLTYNHRATHTLILNINYNLQIATLLLDKILKHNKYEKILIFINEKYLKQVETLLIYKKRPGYNAIFCFKDENNGTGGYKRVLIIEKMEKGMFFG